MRGSKVLPLTCALLACAGAESSPRPQVSRSAPRTETAVEVATPQPEPVVEEPPPPDPIATLLAMTGSETTSIGAPADGRIEGAIALPESGPGFRSNPRRPNAEAIFGTVETLQALVHAAAAVETALPGSTLMINDVGLREGGPIPHHGSHRAGRDVDVLFYLTDRNGDPLEPVGAFLDDRGRGYDFKDLADPRDDVLVRMDLPRTWAFVRALLEGPRREEVQRIFVAEHLRNLLLQYAERSRAPRTIRTRFGELTCQPSYPHDDHFHIRFFCSAEDIAAGCEDATPIYAWRRSALRDLGLTPVVYHRRADRPRSPTVSHEEARQNARGRMHRRVHEWLTRREAWLEPPSAGRAFCR